MKQIRWKTVLALLFLYLGIVFDWPWVLGVLFLFWTLPAFATGSTYLVEEIDRSRNPVLFWLIVLTWVVLSLWLIVAPLFPAWSGSGPTYSSSRVGAYDPPRTPPPPESRGTEGLPSASQVTEAPKPTHPRGALLEDALLEPALLGYAVHDADAMAIQGLSTRTEWNDERYIEDLEALWQRFAETDLRGELPAVVDDRVYVVYSEQDRKRGTFTVTLGYRVPNSAPATSVEAAISLPPTRFAVLQPSWMGPETISATWTQVWDSDLPAAGTHDLEVYTLDPTTYEVEDAEIWVAIDS